MTEEKAKKLAAKFAPVFIQDVARFFIGGDQIAPIDFSGSIADVALNPENFKKFKDKMIPDPKVYYSLCETETHYFIIYAVYHIKDWVMKDSKFYLLKLIPFLNDEHDHDMEGALFVLSKDQNNEPFLDAVITIAHNNFYLFSEPQIHLGWNKSAPKPSRKCHILTGIETEGGKEDIDGVILLDRNTERVKLFIETRGHGIYGDHRKYRGNDWYHDWYYKPEIENRDPDTRIENIKPRTIHYRLEDIFAPGGLWDHREISKVFQKGKSGKWSFAEKKRFNRYKSGKANPPWSWDDQNDKSPIGEIATDPVGLITRYARGWGNVSHNYVHNPYQNIT